MLRPWIPLAAAAALAGCEFFSPPEPTPADDTVLSCGETLVIDAIAEAEAWEIDAPAGTSVDITTALDSPDDSVRLVFVADDSLSRATPFTDPRTGERRLSGFIQSSQRAFVEFLFESSAPTGSLTMTCTTPGENCGDLADNDGDGDIDCADSHCARDPDCLTGQRDFDLSTAPCTDGWELLEVPELRAFSGQRTIYRLEDDDGLREEFWGGGETVIASSVRDRFVQIRSETGGLACLGTDTGTHLFCREWAMFDLDAPYVIADADLPVHLEPLGPAWTDLEVRVDCGAEE